MSWTEIFKVAQIAILVLFVIYASNYRKKKNMVPLVNNKITIVLMIILSIPVLIFGYTIVTLEHNTIIDYISFFTTMIGLLMVIKARYDLGKCHTWVGYYSKDSTLCTKGIYSYIRHPIYTGVCVFIIGGSLSVLVHAEWILVALGAVSISFIIASLCYSATLETRRLKKMPGLKYADYIERVHPFFPIRKYKT
jgi:protein-S-isoprenylcysteine O-methyltransferase Ste14